MTNIKLTPAEIELIRIKREEEALASAKKEAEEMIKAEKQIAEQKARFEKELEEANKQVAAATEYVRSFPAKDWELVIYNNNSNIPRACIHYKEKDSQNRPMFVVSVEKHVVYTSSWSSKGTDKGYKMRLTGSNVEYAYGQKRLKNPKTVIEKVNEVLVARKRKIEAAQEKVSNIKRVITKYQELHPQADVAEDKYYNSYTKVTREIVTITFPNGVRIKLDAYDTTESVIEVAYTGERDATKLVEELSKINYKKVVK